MPPRAGFFDLSKGNSAPVRALPFQSFHFTFPFQYVNMPLNQCRDPPEIFIHVLFIRCFFFYLHFLLLIMFQGQEEPHEENQILKREIGEVIIHNKFFPSFNIVIHLPNGLICSITHLLFKFCKYLIFSFFTSS